MQRHTVNKFGEININKNKVQKKFKTQRLQNKHKMVYKNHVYLLNPLDQFESFWGKVKVNMAKIMSVSILAFAFS